VQCGNLASYVLPVATDMQDLRSLEDSRLEDLRVGSFHSHEELFVLEFEEELNLLHFFIKAQLIIKCDLVIMLIYLNQRVRINKDEV
jgi:hypothetical protein